MFYLFILLITRTWVITCTDTSTSSTTRLQNTYSCLLKHKNI